MYLCVLNADGKIVLHRNIKSNPEVFLKTIAPYREDIVVGVECIFVWYWIADLCAQENIPFVLGHALYMKAIHGGKAKNDKIDAHKIAVLLRGGMIHMAYVYPSEMRSTRDLLRRRTHLVRKRAELLAHVQNTNYQYNLPDIGNQTFDEDGIRVQNSLYVVENKAEWSLHCRLQHEEVALFRAARLLNINKCLVQTLI
jgi:hypothetical protein